MLPAPDDMIRRIALRCGDCGRLFDEVQGEWCYIRFQPARLICLDCKLAEKTRNRVPD